jgi:hypothetical protein
MYPTRNFDSDMLVQDSTTLIRLAFTLWKMDARLLEGTWRKMDRKMD